MNYEEIQKENLRKEIIEMVKEIENSKKGEFLYRIISIIEILPVCECQKISDYLSELYFS